MNKIKAIFIELIPFFIAIIVTTPLKTAPGLEKEILITIIYIGIITVLFLTIYQKQELKLFVLGLIAGIIVEGWGKIMFLFSWQKFNSILPVPLWIPITWGFAFVIMRRIGNIMLKK